MAALLLWFRARHRKSVSLAISNRDSEAERKTAKYASLFRYTGYYNSVVGFEGPLCDSEFQRLADQLQTRILQFFDAGMSTQPSSFGSLHAVKSSKGAVRKQNEDSAALVRVRFRSPDKDFDVGIVCDGLGGMAGGREAATLALSTFIARILRTSKFSPIERMTSAIAEANSQVFESLRGRGGTTLSAVFMQRHGHPVVAHAGDSRVYGVGPERKLTQLSKDDTLGALLSQSAQVHPDQDQASRLIQFVGMGAEFEPHVFSVPAQGYASFLLTSDGAHGVPEAILSRVVAGASDNEDVANRLINLANLLGGFDNATSVIFPSSFESKRDPVEEGIDVTVTSPASELAIWIPAQSSIQGSEAVLSKPSEPEVAPAPKPKSQRRRKPNKRKRDSEDRELPLRDQSEEPIDVDFPDRDRSSS